MSDPKPNPVRPAAFITKPPGVVAFLCVHNASRSQMAEGFARSIAPAHVHIMSAGTKPRGVYEVAVQVMQEVGIDISAHASKHLDEVPWASADTVVTLCNEDEQVCPSLAPEVRQVHWALPDPSLRPEGELVEGFRELRDEIHWRVASLWPRGD